MKRPNWKREGLVALLLIGFGIAVLPALIYFVGQEVIGDYEGANGIGSLYAAILTSLARGEIATWILVLSPYLFILLVRILATVHRSRPGHGAA